MIFVWLYEPLNGEYHSSKRQWDSQSNGWREMEGEGERRKREGWKDHER